MLQREPTSPGSLANERTAAAAAPPQLGSTPLQCGSLGREPQAATSSGLARAIPPPNRHASATLARAAPKPRRSLQTSSLEATRLLSAQLVGASGRTTSCDGLRALSRRWGRRPELNDLLGETRAPGNSISGGQAARRADGRTQSPGVLAAAASVAVTLPSPSALRTTIEPAPSCPCCLSAAQLPSANASSPSWAFRPLNPGWPPGRPPLCHQTSPLPARQPSKG